MKKSEGWHCSNGLQLLRVAKIYHHRSTPPGNCEKKNTLHLHHEYFNRESGDAVANDDLWKMKIHHSCPSAVLQGNHHFD